MIEEYGRRQHIASTPDNWEKARRMMMIFVIVLISIYFTSCPVFVLNIGGGVQSNVVPEKLTAVFDIRLAVTVDHVEFEAMINQWCKEAGEGVTIEFEQKNPYVECTKVDASNPFWTAFKAATDELQLKLDIRIFPGGTDSRYIRRVGIPAIGFSPMNRTPVLLHDHDEYLHSDIYLRGIDIYVNIIKAVANV